MPSLIIFLRNILIASFFGTAMLTLLNYALMDNGIVSYGAEAFGTTIVRGIPPIVTLCKFLIFMFALLLYVFLNRIKVSRWLERYSFGISNIFMGLCIAVAFFASARPYTLLTFVLLFLLLIAIEYINKIRFMSKLYRLFAICFIPFWLINYILVEEKVLEFNAEMRVAFNIGPVPVENMAIFLIMLMITIYIFERLQRAKKV